jgi:hypothetical protein
MKPRKGASPEPAATQMRGVLSSSGKRNAVCVGRTETRSLSPTAREERYEVATPRYLLAGLANEGDSSKVYVRVARLGWLSGEDDMEYCLGRIGGRRERKVPNGSETEGKRSRRSRMEARLRLISLE